MPLITCPDCGREVSPRANACPNCGAPLMVGNQESPGLKAPILNKRKIIIGSAVFCLSIVIGLACVAWRLIPSKTYSNSVGMKFVMIPSGSFVMGSEDVDEPHPVTISEPFYMQATTVTQGQWKTVMGTMPWSGNGSVKTGDDYPAVCVSWDDAQQFITKLDALGSGEYRLPTEAEWEYSCRAGTQTKYSFGEDENKLKDFAWYSENAEKVGEGYAHQVASKAPNPWGLYDMHGNVNEWCQDWGGAYTSFPQVDPKGPGLGTSRVVRGCSFTFKGKGAQSASRQCGYQPDFKWYGCGFRLVRRVEKSFLYNPKAKITNVNSPDPIPSSDWSDIRYLIVAFEHSKIEENELGIYNKMSLPKDQEQKDQLRFLTGADMDLPPDMNSSRLFIRWPFQYLKQWDIVDISRNKNGYIVTVVETFGAHINSQTGDSVGEYKVTNIYDIIENDGVSYIGPKNNNKFLIDKYFEVGRIGTMRRADLKYVGLGGGRI